METFTLLRFEHVGDDTTVLSTTERSLRVAVAQAKHWAAQPAHHNAEVWLDQDVLLFDSEDWASSTARSIAPRAPGRYSWDDAAEVWNLVTPERLVSTVP